MKQSRWELNIRQRKGVGAFGAQPGAGGLVPRARLSWRVVFGRKRSSGGEGMGVPAGPFVCCTKAGAWLVLSRTSGRAVRETGSAY